MKRSQSKLVMGSALGLAALAVAIDHTRHPLPPPQPPAMIGSQQDEASPCSLDGEAPCSLEANAPCSLGEPESPCSLDAAPCSLGESPCSL
jgi:hypothetical protein